MYNLHALLMKIVLDFSVVQYVELLSSSGDGGGSIPVCYCASYETTIAKLFRLLCL